MRILYRFAIVLFHLLILTGKTDATDVADATDTTVCFFSWKDFNLRESFKPPSKAADAAYLSFTAPAGKTSSYSLGAALGYYIAPSKISDRLEGFAFIEYQRDNQISKEQNVLMAGLSVDWTLYDITSSGHAWSPIITGGVDYKNNFVDTLKSLDGNIFIRPVCRGTLGKPKYFWRPGVETKFGSLKMRYYPGLGLEFERVFSARTGGKTGNILRTFAKLKILVTALPDPDDARLLFSTEVNYRHDAVDDLEPADDDHPYWKASVEIVLFRTEKNKRYSSIALDYRNGEEPSVGFKDQEVLKIVLKVKL